jgi:hypothetical protein
MRNDGTVKWSLLRIPIFALEPGAVQQYKATNDHSVLGKPRRNFARCVTHLGDQGESVAGLVK